MKMLSIENFVTRCDAAQLKFSVPVPQEDMDVVVGLLVNMQIMSANLEAVLASRSTENEGGDHER